jgi:hypothetical protein
LQIAKAEKFNYYILMCKKETFTQKKNKDKRKPNRVGRAGGVAQVVKCLQSKHEALISNPMTAKN